MAILRYSLWLMPSGKLYDRLSGVILRLSEEYSAPLFSPHVTLLGEIVGSEKEIGTRTAHLAGLIRPYEIELDTVDYLDEYFRCVFVRAGKTEAVENANRKARAVFGRENDPPYMPHLSLLYGNFSPQVKQEIVAKIGVSFRETFEVRGIHLFATGGKPEEWHRVGEFPFAIEL